MDLNDEAMEIGEVQLPENFDNSADENISQDVDPETDKSDDNSQAGPADMIIPEEDHINEEAGINPNPAASNDEPGPIFRNTGRVRPTLDIPDDLIDHERGGYGLRDRFPGSEAFRNYIERLSDWNHESLMLNQVYVDAMRRQSQMEMDTFVDYLQRDYQERQARLEAATMLFVFYIPPIWKRAIAELIDFFILLFIKLVVTFLILDTFNIATHLANMNISQWVDNPQLVAQFSTEIALLEIPFRIIVIFYETYFSLKYAGTPGKRIMGLRLILVRELHVMEEDVLRANVAIHARTCVRVFPADVLPLRFALMRSVLKNAFVGLLMSPVCFSFIFVNQNRTGYDVMTNSMVVEFKAGINQPGPIWN